MHLIAIARLAAVAGFAAADYNVRCPASNTLGECRYIACGCRGKLEAKEIPAFGALGLDFSIFYGCKHEGEVQTPSARYACTDLPLGSSSKDTSPKTTLCQNDKTKTGTCAGSDDSSQSDKKASCCKVQNVSQTVLFPQIGLLTVAAKQPSAEELVAFIKREYDELPTNGVPLADGTLAGLTAGLNAALMLVTMNNPAGTTQFNLRCEKAERITYDLPMEPTGSPLTE